MTIPRCGASALLTALLLGALGPGAVGTSEAQQAAPAVATDTQSASTAAEAGTGSPGSDAAPLPPEAAADETQLTPEELAAQKVFSEAAAAAVSGPKDIPIRDQAKLQLPQGFRFIPQREAKAVLELMGNRVGPDFVGMVLPEETGNEADWLVVISYEDSGHIADDDAKEWNADDLLDGLKKGTEA